MNDFSTLEMMKRDDLQFQVLDETDYDDDDEIIVDEVDIESFDDDDDEIFL